jgi:hypothetical protein
VVFAEDALPRPNTPHPETGEMGTWIPLWLEREHVLDDAKLTTCREELHKVDVALREAHASMEGFRVTVEDLKNLVDETEARELALRERLKKKDEQLERRTKLAWASSQTALAALGALALLLWLH